MAARAHLGAPTVRTPTDNGTPVEDLNTSTARNPYHWKETGRKKRFQKGLPFLLGLA